MQFCRDMGETARFAATRRTTNASAVPGRVRNRAFVQTETLCRLMLELFRTDPPDEGVMSRIPADTKIGPPGGGEISRVSPCLSFRLNRRHRNFTITSSFRAVAAPYHYHRRVGT